MFQAGLHYVGYLMQCNEICKAVESHAGLKGRQAVAGQLKGNGPVAPCSCSQGEKPLPCSNVQQHLWQARPHEHGCDNATTVQSEFRQRQLTQTVRQLPLGTGLMQGP